MSEPACSPFRPLATPFGHNHASPLFQSCRPAESRSGPRRRFLYRNNAFPLMDIPQCRNEPAAYGMVDKGVEPASFHIQSRRFPISPSFSLLATFFLSLLPRLRQHSKQSRVLPPESSAKCTFARFCDAEALEHPSGVLPPRLYGPQACVPEIFLGLLRPLSADDLLPIVGRTGFREPHFQMPQFQREEFKAALSLATRLGGPAAAPPAYERLRPRAAPELWVHGERMGPPLPFANVKTAISIPMLAPSLSSTTKPIVEKAFFSGPPTMATRVHLKSLVANGSPGSTPKKKPPRNP